MSRDWSYVENAATIADYFSMLEQELRGDPYNKSEHRRQLSKLLSDRSERAIDSKHQNISAVLLQLGMPWIIGYKPLVNYQQSLRRQVEELLNASGRLIELAEVDASSPVPHETPDNILEALTAPPASIVKDRKTLGTWTPTPGPINFLERESRSRDLGLAGERFVLEYERARLRSMGESDLAARIEHVSQEGRDHEGFDIRSFEADGKDRLIEVKTTRYAPETPFFVSRNQVGTSELRSELFHLYRVYNFKIRPRFSPKFFILQGNLRRACILEPMTFAATVA